MKHQYVETDSQLLTLCDQLSDAKLIGFDTEFVAEDTYQPDLCLIQVAAAEHLAVIDPHAINDLAPFWDLLTQGDHVTIAHSAREEFLFVKRATGLRPRNLFDTQIAAGFAGLEYPTSYSKLVRKLVGRDLPKGETRTDWRRRPLTKRQIEYALHDVVDLEAMHTELCRRLESTGRRDWLADEMIYWQDQLEAAVARPRWRRISGITGLDRRALAIARELWQWRDTEAESRNRPPRRVMRDDVLVELARRKTADPERIKSLREFQRDALRRRLPEIAAAIEKGLQLSDDQMPTRERRETPRQLQLLGQFLATALTSICSQAKISHSLVGTVQDVRDLISLHFGWQHADDPAPILSKGWRAEIVGQCLEQLMDGTLSIRITDPLSSHPLSFDETTD